MYSPSGSCIGGCGGHVVAGPERERVKAGDMYGECNGGRGFRPDLVTGGVEFVQIGVSSGDKTAAGDSTVVWT